LPVAVLRCGNVYGGGDLNFSRIIPGTIRSLRRGQPPVIRSDGKFIRDYIFVKDVSLAYLAVAERMDGGKIDGEAFNFGNGKPLSVIEIVRLVQKAMRREDLRPKILNSVKAEIREQYLACDKARKVLKWQPRYSMQEAMEETVGWYRDLWS
jgi:CDP-glucose 4,6-dehydratase